MTHKLHVLPNEKLPFDRYQRTTSVDDVRDLIGALASNGAPWFLVLNVKGAHRPFRNSDETEIGVDPDDVRLPGHLPDTPTVRRDWAEYLDAIELTDELVGETLAILRETGQMDRTLVVYTSDHGPAFQRGKMSLHDLGVRVPLVFSGPGVEGGRRSSALASSVDLMPTLLDLLAIESDIPFDGRSLAPLLAGGADTAPPRYVFGEIDHQVDRHDRGMRERSVYDGRHRLIWRNDGRKPRTVNADIWRWARWRNRTYEETVKRRVDFPDAFRVLRQVDTGRLRARAPQRELYDLERDPDELVDLAGSVADRPTRLRLESALCEWARATGDDSFGNAVNGSTDAARPARGGGGGE